MGSLLKFIIYAGLVGMVATPLILIYMYHKIQDKLNWILDDLDILMFMENQCDNLDKE